MNDKLIENAFKALEALREGTFYDDYDEGWEGVAALREMFEGYKAMLAATEADLSTKMQAAGMTAYEELTKRDCLSPFNAHAAVKDAESFKWWVENRYKKYTLMQVNHQLDQHILDDDILEFVMGKASAFREVMDNYRKAFPDE